MNIELLPVNFGAALDSITKFCLMILFYVGPFFFIPALMQRAGGMFAALTGAINNKSKGLFDRNRNWRGGMRKRGMEESITGKSKAGQTRTAELARRMKFAREGGINMGLTSSRRAANAARYAEVKRAMMMKSADKMVQEDGGRAGGDDDAMALAVRGIKGSEFIEQYTRMAIARASAEGRTLDSSAAREQAIRALGSSEANFGAKMGSDAMRVAAFKALTASNTSYFDKAAYDRGENQSYVPMMEDAASLVSAGLMTATDAAAAIKSNKMRADRSGISFGSLLAQVQTSAGRYSRGARGARVFQGSEEQALMDSVTSGAEPGQLLGGRYETVAWTAPHDTNDLRKAEATEDTTKIYSELAGIAGRYAVLGQVSKKKQQIYANKVMGQVLTIDGKKQTIRAHIEEARIANPVLEGEQRFLDLRQEITNNGLRDVADLNRRQIYGAQSQQPTATPGGDIGSLPTVGGQ